MPIETESYLIDQDGWTMRVQAPRPGSSPNPVLLLIHGWTGDEKSMWVFSHRLSSSFWKIAPRGPVQAPDGGFGWHTVTSEQPIQLSDFRQSAAGLLERLDHWASSNHVDARQVNLLGFSQGAMLVYAINLLFPERVGLSGALAGYMPSHWINSDSASHLAGKSFYLAHGTLDETIPVAYARETARRLESAGARVNFCEAPVGHKLSANCLNDLGHFFNQAVLPSAD